MTNAAWIVAGILAIGAAGYADYTRNTPKIWVDPLTYCHYVVNAIVIQPRLYRDGSQICIKGDNE